MPGKRSKSLIAAGALALGGFCLLTVLALDTYQLQRESALVAAKQFDEAAKLAPRIKVLRFMLVPRLRSQIAALGPAESLPLRTALLAITGDSADRAALEAARLAAADPTQISLANLKLSLGAAEVPPDSAPELKPSAYFEAAPTPESPSPWGQTFALARKDAAGAWQSLGEGFAGLLGSSFELAPDDRTLWLAREAEQRLERWDLASGTHTDFKVAGPPGLLAIAPPGAADRVAYSLGAGEGDVLYLLENGESRRLYPQDKAAPTPLMGFRWAPDGQSLLVMWEEIDPDAKRNTQVVWLRPTGQIGLEATLDAPLADLEPLWITGEGRMGLALAPGNWVWPAGSAAALPLDDVGEVWCFSPGGDLVAGVDGGAVIFAKPGAAGKKMAHSLPDLSPNFEPDPAGFSWVKGTAGREQLTLKGRVPGSAPDSYRDVTITADVSLRR